MKVSPSPQNPRQKLRKENYLLLNRHTHVHCTLIEDMWVKEAEEDLGQEIITPYRGEPAKAITPSRNRE